MEETEMMSRKPTRHTPLILLGQALLGQALLGLADACRDIRAASRAG
jgi:hypothetical protein